VTLEKPEAMKVLSTYSIILLLLFSSICIRHISAAGKNLPLLYSSVFFKRQYIHKEKQKYKYQQRPYIGQDTYNAAASDYYGFQRVAGIEDRHDL
jgi:hypothetical protein